MQVCIALITLAVSIIVSTTAFNSNNDTSVAIGAFGIVAGLALLLSIRIGFYALGAIMVLLIIGAILGDAGAALPFAVIYGLLTFLAYRVKVGKATERHRRQVEAERAERMDRYVRQQLGE